MVWVPRVQLKTMEAGREGGGQGGEIVLVRRQGGAGIVLVKVMEEAPAGEWEDEALY